MRAGAGRGRRSWATVSAASLALAGLFLLGAAAAGGAIQAQVELRVAKAGPGAGTVRTPSGQLACGSRCASRFASGRVVMLLATPGPTSVFKAWSGACTGAAPRCALVLDRGTSVTARFEPAVVRVELVVSGRGEVTSEPGGLQCGGAAAGCSARFVKGAKLTLTAKAGQGSAFVGWSGACSGTEGCTLTPSGDTSLRATFRRAHAVSATVSGPGRVESALWPGCDPPCSAVSPAGEEATLRAVPAAGQSFRGWSGDCRGLAETCVVRTDAPTSVSASFGAAFAVPGTTPLLSVTASGPGTVAGGGITCGTVCAVRPTTATVDLVATPVQGAAVFAGWGGDCSGTAPVCRVTLSAARTVTATFRRTFTLTYTPGGQAPAATVTPPGETCNAVCEKVYDAGEVVTLTVDVPSGPPILTAGLRWSGACVGSGPICTVAVDAATAVTADLFTTIGAVAKYFGLVVTMTRRGTIAAAGEALQPPFTCVRGAAPRACAASARSDRKVTLTARPPNRFLRWTGSCRGARPTCELTMSSAKTVIAQFRP